MIDYSEMRRYVEDRIARGLDVPELNAQHVKDLLDHAEKLEHKCEAMGRFISVCRLRKRNYLRATKWFMANTKVDLGEMPENIRLTLQSIVETMIAKAKKVTDKGKTDE